MDNLGELLRQARLEKGKTLEEIAEETKIRVRYLQAIEENNLDILPGHFYTRGFIKSYAEAVGLNPEELLKLYVPEEKTEEDEASSSLPPRRVRYQSYRIQPKPSFFTKGFSSLLLLLFVGLIVVVIYWFMTSQGGEQGGQTLPPESLPKVSVEDKEPTSPPLAEGGTQPDEAANRDGAVPEPETTPSEEEPVDAGQLILVEQEGPNHVYALTGGELAILLEAKGRCWVELRATDAKGKKGKKLFSKELQPGETLVWPEEGETVPDAVRLRVGAPAAIQLTISGHPIETDHFSSPQNFIIKQNAINQDFTSQ
ncbi:MAG: DUF4115 domain-containing protein [Bacillota bacterium]|mgnify:FL=1